MSSEASSSAAIDCAITEVDAALSHLRRVRDTLMHLKGFPGTELPPVLRPYHSWALKRIRDAWKKMEVLEDQVDEVEALEDKVDDTPRAPPPCARVVALREEKETENKTVPGGGVPESAESLLATSKPGDLGYPLYKFPIAMLFGEQLGSPRAEAHSPRQQQPAAPAGQTAAPAAGQPAAPAAGQPAVPAGKKSAAAAATAAAASQRRQPQRRQQWLQHTGKQWRPKPYPATFKFQ